jgi:acyl carrier protein
MQVLSKKEISLAVKKIIVETLNMEGIVPEEIKNDIPLLSGENIIKIDSIDVLELVIAIQRKFNVRIDDKNLARHIIHSIDTITDFIHSQQTVYSTTLSA